MKFTYPITLIGWPVLGCYENETGNIFNTSRGYPTGQLLPYAVNDNMHVLSVKGHNKQSQSIVFKPKVKAGTLCKNQDIHASFSSTILDDSHVKFDAEVSTNNIPP